MIIIQRKSKPTPRPILCIHSEMFSQLDENLMPAEAVAPFYQAENSNREVTSRLLNYRLSQLFHLHSSTPVFAMLDHSFLAAAGKM